MNHDKQLDKDHPHNADERAFCHQRHGARLTPI